MGHINDRPLFSGLASFFSSDICGAVHSDSEDAHPATCTYPHHHGPVGPSGEPQVFDHGKPEGGVWWMDETVTEGVTNRGFRLWEFPNADYAGQDSYTVTVQESSLASQRKVWVGPRRGDRMHLGVLEARMLRDALTQWLGDEVD